MNSALQKSSFSFEIKNLSDTEKRTLYFRLMESAQSIHSEYWRSRLPGDKKTVDKIILHRQIFRTRKKADSSRYQAAYLRFLLKRLGEMQLN